MYPDMIIAIVTNSHPLVARSGSETSVSEFHLPVTLSLRPRSNFALPELHIHPRDNPNQTTRRAAMAA